MKGERRRRIEVKRYDRRRIIRWKFGAGLEQTIDPEQYQPYRSEPRPGGNRRCAPARNARRERGTAQAGRRLTEGKSAESVFEIVHGAQRGRNSASSLSKA